MSQRGIVRLMIILFILFLIGVNQFILNDSYNDPDHQIELKNQILKVSGYWELEPIQIDGNAKGPGAKNWTWAEDQDWCSGLGTIDTPYVIENITIDSLNAESCITIVNSNIYFMIKNCTLINAEVGIHFNNVANGNISETKIFSPIANGGGIYIKDSHNITFFYNDITDCSTGFGFDYEYCTNINILKNNISFSSTAINLWGNGSGKNIVISENRIFNNTFALSIFKYNQCEISNNLFYNNTYGFEVEYMKNSTISGNLIDNVENNPALFLRYFVNNTIINNNITNCPTGILMYFSSHKNVIRKNNLYNCRMNGIGISSAFNSMSDFNRISENSIINNGYAGIYIATNNNSVVNNTIEFYKYGIYIDGQNNNISRNLINFNTEYGIKLDSAHQNIIINNTLKYNKFGIFLDHSNNNSILGNRIILSYECITLYHSYDNIIKYNYCKLFPTIRPITILGYNVFIVLCLILIINGFIRIKSKVIN